MTLLQAEPSTPDAPDYAAGSLLRSLGHLIGRNASWGLVKTLLLTALSFGMAPLLVWPRLLRDLITAEHNRFMHLAEWMRGISGDRNCRRLMLAADRIRPQPFLSYLPGMLPIAVIGLFVAAFISSGATQQVAFGSTWSYAQNVNRGDTVDTLFVVWTGGLTLAYVLHWLQLLLHVNRVRDAVTEFNHLAGAEGLAPVPVPGGFGLRPAWLVAGVLLMGAGSALWAVPAMLGGALQRRYVTIGVPDVQLLLADRVRQLLSHRRPAMFVPTPVSTPRKCPNDRCRASMARVANFCPRCGTRVGPEVNALA